MTDAPLNYQASATSHPEVSTSLPVEVVTCLKNARFLHLATCTLAPNPTPHISLMNYTYLPSTPYTTHPTIIMTTNPSSQKTLNLLSNPRVSLLVHDWISHRPPTLTQQGSSATNTSQRPSSPPRAGAAATGGLAALLYNLNSSALSRISTTITGEARFVERGSEEEGWCKKAHLDNNTFTEGRRASSAGGAGLRSGAMAGLAERRERDLGGSALAGTEEEQGDENASAFIEGEDVRVIIVRVREGRIADWKGGVKDWVLVEDGEETGGLLTNGVMPTV